MYEDFFGFSRRPFSLTPDPEFLFWTDQHRRTFDLVCMSLMRHAPIALVTGEIGTGKTTLIQELLHEVSGDLEVALLSNVVGDSGDLLRWILTAFGRQAEPSSPAEALREVEAFLRGAWAEGRRSLLIVDEAQNVSDSGIETLRLLTNLDVGKATPLSLLLVGQPELRDRLSGPRFGAFRQRLGASSHLGPMTLAETTGYVRSRLRIAGGDADIFDHGAIEAVHRRAMGVPRLTNLLCDVCLVSAFGENRRRLDAAFAETALAETVAVGGLGGLTADAAEADEAVAQRAAAVRSATAPLVKVARAPSSARPEGRAAAESRRPASPPSLRLVTGGPPPSPDVHGEADPAPPAPPEPFRLEAARPAAAGERPAARPRSAEDADAVWRLSARSVAGVAVAASLVCVALVLPATWTDAGQSAVATLLGEPDGASLARVQPTKATAAPTSRQPHADPARVSEARLAPDDAEGAEALFRAALNNAAADRVAAAVDYSRAAARGHARAAYYLAQMYETGDGVGFAPDTARAWYALAADDVGGAAERLVELAADPGPEVGSATPLFSEAGNGTAELVWQGRGSFVVELAAAPGGAPDAVHSTPLTAVRLESPANAAWWRVRAVGGPPSEWHPIGPAPDGDELSMR